MPKLMRSSNERIPIPFLDEFTDFPPVHQANEMGLLAMGGDLSPGRLMDAYSRGIFPWFNEDELILWWSPDPRMVLFPDRIKVSKSMRKIIREGQFRLTHNERFRDVIERCSNIPRHGQEGTWITEHMKQAYVHLHELGRAHSYEVWEGERMVGGLYGVDLGFIFCGESMFSEVSNASKFALIQVAQKLGDRGYLLIDCQSYTAHLEGMGAELIPRREFIDYLSMNREL